METEKVSPALVHMLNDDNNLVYVAVLEKRIFDQIPFPEHRGALLSKPVMLADGRGVIFQYVEEGNADAD